MRHVVDYRSMATMSEQTPENTFTLTLAGREILFYHTSPGQLTAMQRYLDKLRTQFSASEGETALNQLYTKINKVMLDVVDGRFVNEEDRDWAEQQMMLGKLELAEVLEVLRNGAPRPAVIADDADPVKQPGRKRPAAKKTVKKTTANPRRVKQ